MKLTSRTTSEEFVKRSVIKFLTHRGWSRSLEWDDAKVHGVDIKVTNSKYGRTFFIETKGTSTSRSSAENAFIHSLGQIVTRMKNPDARYYYGLALTEASAAIAIRRVPFQFAVKAHLHIFSVNNQGEVRWFQPRDIKRLQKAAAGG